MGETETAPWPVVAECHWPAPSMVKREHTCAQCDGSHTHQWLTWRTPVASILGVCTTGSLPVRCTVCGARKCDQRDCSLRRHHGEPHEPF